MREGKVLQKIMKLKNFTRKSKLEEWMVSFFISFSCMGCLFLKVHSISGYIAWVILLTVGSWVIRKFILFIFSRNWIEKFLNDSEKFAKVSIDRDKEIALKCILIIAVNSIIYWVAFYPGNMFVDTYYQFTQIFNWLPPSNWHCYGHTLFMKIIIQCTGDPAMIVLLQIIAVLYIMYLIFRELHLLGFNDNYIYIFASLFSVSLSYGLQITNIWKDSMFSIAQLYTVYFLYKNYETKFVYLNHAVIGGIGMFGMMLFRHNGVLVGGIIFVTIIFISENKFKPIVFSAAIMTVFFLLTHFGFAFMGIAPNSKVTSYLPMLHGIAAVEKEIGSNGLDPETKQLMDELLPEKLWIEKYNPFNGDPYLFDVNEVLTEKCENYALLDILSPYLKTFLRHPFTIIKDRLSSCELVWNLFPVDGSYNHIIGPNIDNSIFDNDTRLTENFNIIPSNSNNITILIQKIFNFIYNNTILNIIHFRPAWLLWILAIVLIILSRHDIKTVIVAFPVIINVCTLLLAMNFQAYRYVWGVFLCTPNIVLLMIGKQYQVIQKRKIK